MSDHRDPHDTARFADFSRSLSSGGSLSSGAVAPPTRPAPQTQIGGEMVGHLFAAMLLLPRLLASLAARTDDPERWLEHEQALALHMLDAGTIRMEPESQREHMTDLTRRAVEAIFRSAEAFAIPVPSSPDETKPG